MNQLLLNDDEATFVHCKYQGDTSEIIVVPEVDARRTKEMPEIEILDEWPHVGKKLLMKCKFRTQDRDKYELKWDCSTCDEVSSRISRCKAWTWRNSNMKVSCKTREGSGRATR